MAEGSSVDLNQLFKSSVEALAAIDEPWIALSVLAEADVSKRHRGKVSDELFEAALSKFARLATAADIAGIISKNDILDDIATNSIKFLLLPYLLSRVHSAYQGEQSDRFRHLQDSRKCLIEFFDSIENFGLLSKPDRERVLDDSVDIVRMPSQKREEKIARFRAEKAAERKLFAVVERRKTHSSSSSYVVDEEIVRDAALTILQSAVRKGLDDITSIDDEMQLLRFACAERSKGRDPRVTAETARETAPATVFEGLPPAFRIVDKTEEIRRGVFKPSHSLPTYTVEEWGEIELGMAQKREQERKNAEIVKVREQEDEDSDTAADRETMEKRSWDDWRDENNKGSGNTMR